VSLGLTLSAIAGASWAWGCLRVEPLVEYYESKGLPPPTPEDITDDEVKLVFDFFIGMSGGLVLLIIAVIIT